jgi:putative transposase
MIPSLLSFLICLGPFFRSRYSLSLEILVLRQQLGVFKRKHPRPRLQIHDRILWVLLPRLWPAWNNVLVIVKPETVVVWHRAGFRMFWRLRSRPKSTGRPKIDAEVRTLIRRMAKENPSWGGPRIHGELLKLGFDVSERTVSRYLRRLSLPTTLASSGLLSFAITARSSRPWTSSLCRPLPSESCIVFSSSNMVDAGSSISTSRNTRLASGLCSN